MTFPLALALALAAPPGGAYDDVRAVLRRAGPELSASVELTRALAALGPESIEVQYQLVLGTGMDELVGEEWVPEAWACQPDDIPELCRHALSQMPPKKVLAHLAGVLRTRPSIEERMIVLRILTGLRAAAGLELVWSMVDELGPLELGYPRLRGAVRSAMVAILGHAPEAWGWVAERLERTTPTMLALLVEALGEVRLPQGMPILGALLERGALPEATVLDSMVALESHSPWALGGTVERHLDRRFRALEPERRAFAAVLAGRLLLASTVPDLLTLLDDGDPRVRAAAASSLAELGRRPSDLDPARWSEWYERELGWRQERAPRLLEALASPGAGPAGEALRELFAHPLWRRELAREVAACLARAPRSVGVSACAMLERAALRDAIPGLVQALEARDPRLRKAAWDALKATSGKSLPLDREAWQEFVHTGRI